MDTDTDNRPIRHQGQARPQPRSSIAILPPPPPITTLSAPYETVMTFVSQHICRVNPLTTMIFHPLPLPLPRSTLHLRTTWLIPNAGAAVDGEGAVVVVEVVGVGMRERGCEGGR